MLSKYVNFADVFSPKLVVELWEHGISNYTIKLVDDRQFPYGSIDSLGLVKLETLKAYIKNNLANNFIRLLKSITRAAILFDKKLDGKLRLCVDYQGLNNLTIKNRYLLPLVGELLDQLGRVWHFIQLNLTNIYH